MIPPKLVRFLLVVLTLLPAGRAAGQSFPTFNQRRDWLLGLPIPANSIAGSGKYGMPFAVARLWQTNGQDTASRNFAIWVAETKSYTDTAQTIRDWDAESIFEPVGVVRAVLQWNAQFTSAEHTRIADGFRAKRNWGGGGTSNHEMLRWSNGYLLAQKYGGSWYLKSADVTPMSAASMMAQLKANFKLRAEEVFRQDMDEYNSPNYLTHHLIPLVNLYDYCQDAELKEIAEAMLARHLAALSLCVHQGTILEPFARSGPALNNGYQNVGANVLGTGNGALLMNWLYWGQINPTVGRVQERYGGGPDLIYLAASNYRTPDRLVQLANGQAGLPFEAKLMSSDWHDTGTTIRRYAWRTASYGIGSGVRSFSPDGYYLAHPRFGVHWSSPDAMHTLQVGHPYWQSDEATWTGWLKSTDSPFMQTAHYRHLAIILFNHPTADPWPTRGRIDWYPLRAGHVNSLRTEVYAVYPTSVDERPVYSYPDGTRWYFIREGDTYIGLRVLTTTWTDTNPDGLSAILARTKANGQRWQSAFVIEVGTAAEHGTFANFQTRLKANTLTVNWGTGTIPAQTVTYNDGRGTTLSATYNTSLTEDANKRIWMAPSATLNGVNYNWSGWPLLQGPYVNISNKVLSINEDATTRIYDLSDLPTP